MWLLKSSIGKKLIMSLSGLFLITFLTLHGVVNFIAIFSGELYNEACHFMGTNPIVQVMVPVLALGFVVHIIYAAILTLQNRKARGNDRYGVASKTDISFASKNMFVLGVIVIGVLVWHLTHFWAKMQLLEWQGQPSELGYDLVRTVFSQWYVVVGYIIWFVAIWYHLTHGFWSAFQSLGWNNKIWYKRLKAVGVAYATIIVLMFVAVAVYFYLQNCGICPVA